MCGIAGFLELKRISEPDALGSIARNMAQALAHRGPDDEGVWADANSGVAMSHRRLSIIDCDPSGHQPMISGDGRFVISYNGEVYNFREIAAQLRAEGIAIHGGSDTGVLLSAFGAWGIERTLRQCVGMFAFALWDRKTNTLTLARDRLGIKPLYWSASNDLVAFASQLKALRCHPAFCSDIDRRSVASFVRLGYVPSPHTIFEEVRKLLPGHYVTISSDGDIRETCYWNLRQIAGEGARHPFEGTPDDAVDQIEALLTTAVRDRMVSDVPIGCFLSGGIDSSTVSALMQSLSDRPIRTFSIGFDERGYDESASARAIAEHLGTDHTELRVSPQHALDLVSDIPTWFDEPFADSSQIPTLLLSKLVKDHVTVALSGDGGDEVFAGYNRYHLAPKLDRLISSSPRWARSGLASAMRMLPSGFMNATGNALPERLVPRQLGDRLHKAAGVLSSNDISEVYRRLISQWANSDAIMPHADGYHTLAWDETTSQERPDLIGRLQLTDMATYLPDDILCKVDRASMAFALEARVPILDHRVVEFSWTLPREMLIRDGKTKWPLRRILDRHVPRDLIERPKMGFGAPIDAWLRGPLREWAGDLLAPDRLRSDGLFNAAEIQDAFKSHLSGHRNMAYSLWTILMYQSWADKWTNPA